MDSCVAYHNQQGTAGSSIYSTVASMTFVNWNNVTIMGNSDFQDNFGPVITAYNSNLNLKGKILFQDNAGSNGAAISLLQSSYLIVHEHLNVTFINNEALLYGGAIYSNGEDVPGNQECAIQIYSNKTSSNELDIKMTFIGNKAKLTGNSILANPLYNCSQFYSFNIPKNIDIRTLLSITFDPIQNGMQQMSSEPMKICLCNSSNMNYTTFIIHCTDSSSIRPTIHTYPGKAISLYLAAVDQSHQLVYSPAVAEVSIIYKLRNTIIIQR